MTLVEYNVGKTEHIYAKSNLRLKTRCFVKLSSFHGMIFPFSTLFQKLDTLVSSGAFVARSNQLRFSIQLFMEDLKPQDLDRANFMEGLAAIFCGAEIWKQLGLKACQLHPEGQDFPYPSDDLCFSVRHLSMTLNDVDKSGGEPPFASYGTKRPLGIPSAFLEHIQIKFSFSYLHFRSHGKRYKFGFLEELEPPMLLAEDHLDKRVDQTDMPQSLSYERSLSYPTHSGMGFLPPHNSQDQGKMMSGIRENSISHLFDDCLLGSPSRNLTFELPLERPPAKRAPRDYIEKEDRVTFADLAKLVDAGLRTMISGDKIQPLTGVTLLSGHSGPKLAEISPTLFRPGYLSAIWEHDRYFDTIARTTVIVYGHSRSRSLRNKIEALERFAPEEYFENDVLNARTPQTSEEILLKAVKVRLWRLTLSALLCRPGSTRLKPLDWTDARFGHDLDEEKMLEQEGPPNLENGSFRSGRKAAEVLLFGQNRETEENNALVREDLFNVDNRAWDDEDLFVGEGDMMEAFDLQDEDLFWEDDYYTIPEALNIEGDVLFWENYGTKSGIGNDRHENEFSRRSSRMLFDNDENLTDGLAPNPSLISPMHHEPWSDEILLDI